MKKNNQKCKHESGTNGKCRFCDYDINPVLTEQEKKVSRRSLAQVSIILGEFIGMSPRNINGEKVYMLTDKYVKILISKLQDLVNEEL